MRVPESVLQWSSVSSSSLPWHKGQSRMPWICLQVRRPYQRTTRRCFPFVTEDFARSHFELPGAVTMPLSKTFNSFSVLHDIELLRRRAGGFGTVTRDPTFGQIPIRHIPVQRDPENERQDSAPDRSKARRSASGWPARGMQTRVS